MGWKSTETLTRADAEARYVRLHLEYQAEKRRRRNEERLREVSYIPLPYRHGARDLHDLDLETRDKFEIFHAVDAAMREDKWRRQARKLVADMADATLENDLERLSDLCGGTYNFSISEYADDR